MYRDLSAEPDARQKLDEVTPLSAVLDALRFERVGLVAAGRGGAVAEIWRSPQKDAYAEPEWHPGRTPHLVFRTLFSDGTIVQTSEPRKGGFRFVPFWVRQHHPAAGYLLEEVPGPPHQVWLRHRARIDELKAQLGAPPLHDGADTFVALATRSLRITRLRTRLSQWIGIAAFMPVAAWATLSKDAPGWALPLTAVVWLGVTWGVFRLCLMLPWPKKKPLAP